MDNPAMTSYVQTKFEIISLSCKFENLQISKIKLHHRLCLLLTTVFKSSYKRTCHPTMIRKISNLIVLCCFFITNGGNGAWVRAVDNNTIHRRQLASRIRSTDDVGRSSLQLPKARTSRSAVLDLVPSAASTALPSSFSDTQSDRDEHNEWLLQQQQYAQQFSSSSSQYSSTSSTYQSTRRKGNSLLPSFLSTASFAEASKSVLEATKSYAQRVQGESPTTFWTAFSSILIFLCWNLVPAFHATLMKCFLASRRTAKSTFGLSLVLSAVSHNSFRHVLFNLLAFLSLSPALLSVKVPSSSWAAQIRTKHHVGLSKPSLWPFLVGGALSGNLLFLLLRVHGSCLGLSGVVCAMLAAYACAAPERVMRIRIYGVLPVSLKMKHLVQTLFVVSLVGGLFLPSSQICHLGHLGGLLFGILYYQTMFVKRRNRNTLI